MIGGWERSVRPWTQTLAPGLLDSVAHTCACTVYIILVATSYCIVETLWFQRSDQGNETFTHEDLDNALTQYGTGWPPSKFYP